MVQLQGRASAVQLSESKASDVVINELCWMGVNHWPVGTGFRFDLKTLPVDFVECLMRFLPTENEVKVLRLYERERKPVENLSDEDRFMMQFSKIERLMQKMTIMAFIGNFAESIQMLTPVSWPEQGYK